MKLSAINKKLLTKSRLRDHANDMQSDSGDRITGNRGPSACATPVKPNHRKFFKTNMTTTELGQV